ncbi:tyrosine--tRNA ligase [bacterium]|nr:tyrosine--tRNA ligase [bacterium]
MTESVLTYLKRRGHIADQTHPELDALLAAERFTLYAGFDPTAESLHVGNLAIIIMLRRFQAFGHQPIALVGGGTAMIGDPSGREIERQLQTREIIAARGERVREQLSRFLRFDDAPGGALMRDNFDWLSSLSLIDFLRDVGKHFRVQDMVARESVRRRLDRHEGISFTEFSYQLLQSYDFYHMFLADNCRLQVGGSDQWGNITAGTDLIRTITGKGAYGITAPLVTRSDGTKFGKSDDGQGNVWLDAAMTSPFDFYQFWLKTDDRDVMRYLLMFTEVDGEDLARVSTAHEKNPGDRVAHRRLAFEVTALVHGEDAARDAEEAAKAAFYGKGKNVDISSVPTTDISRATLADGYTIADAFVAAGLVTSKGEARRKAAQGGLRVNECAVTDATATITEADFEGDRCVLRFGKQRVHVLRLAGE